MSKFCMIETAFDNISQVNKVVDTLLEKKLVARCGGIQYSLSIDAVTGVVWDAITW